ncbi:hypothetical protein ABZ419_11370 [Streptomyces cinnamoneus]|uniref:hypothetical protein n=1 Tax=Streptomyces cinnamoneus TaxID=53446 RepID=UPI0033C7470A
MSDLRVTPDEYNHAKYDVEHGDDHLGVIFDETPAGLSRGGWAAWSPKAKRRDGIVGFFATKEDAAAAIAKTHGIDMAAPEEPQKNCVSILGGKVHGLTPLLNANEDDVFPRCRTGASSHQGTRYITTTAALTCSNCLAQEEYRRRARSAA